MILWLLGCPAQPVDPTWGQWIWTDADARVFEQSRADVPDLVPTVWIGTIHGDGHVDLGHSPRGFDRPAVLVRVDDDWSWDADADALLAEKVGRLLTMTRDAGVEVREVQLDYDCPASKLPRYAAALRPLGRPWITSVPAHLADPAYGDLLRDVAAGHLVQVFDNGREVAPDALLADLDRAAMPFRLGIGAFERADGGVPVTDHRAWFAKGAPVRHSRWYRGSWVFPANRPWTALREGG